MGRPLKDISRTVWILSLISLFTDAASEMLYPIMPIYLRSIGFSVVLIGVLEGFAEATAGLSKGYFGKWSDLSGRRVPFVQLGYALSALSKPMMGLFSVPWWIFGARTVDRLGKGVRTGARDAMLSDESPSGKKGRVFGFHRSMDTLGAVIGPALALVFLHYRPNQYRALFFIAAAPAALAIAASLLLTERRAEKSVPRTAVSLFAFINYWRSSPAPYRRVVIGLLVFALFNSSDVFLLLQVKGAGLTDAQTIMMYIFYNLVFAVTALPVGMLADRAGFKRIFLLGLAIFAVVYGGMAIGGGLWFLTSLFFLYGLYAAATDGLAKAWISDFTNPADTATAIGTFAGFQSLCTLVASSLAGLLWFQFGSAVTFAVTALMTVVVIGYLLIVVPAKGFGAPPSTSAHR